MTPLMYSELFTHAENDWLVAIADCLLSEELLDHGSRLAWATALFSILNYIPSRKVRSMAIM